MEIFDHINMYLVSSPDSLEQLEMMFRIKFWLLLAVAVYFLSLPYRQRRKEKQQDEQSAKQPGKNGKFLA